MGGPIKLKLFHAVAALMAFTGLGYGQAWGQTDAVAVLGVEATDGAPETVATAITGSMRQKITSAPGFRLVSGRDLVEIKLVFSCPDEAPSCMAQAAQSLGAEKLIFGSVKKAPGGSYLVTLKLLDARKGKVESYIAEQLTRTQAAGPAIRGPVQKWFADLTGRNATGVIRVSADVIGASISIDGLPMGVTRDGPVDLESIATGNHEIVLSKPDHEPVKRQVTVEVGRITDVSVSMAQETLAPPPVGATDGARVDLDTGRADGKDDNAGLKYAAWGTAGAGVLAVVLALKFGTDVASVNSDLDPFRRLPCSVASSGYCDGRGRTVPNAEVDLTETERGRVQSLRNDGERAELLQYVFYGTSAVLLGTSAYLFYTAYLADDSPESSVATRDRRTHRAGAPVLAPYLNANGGGFTARFAF